MVYNIAAGPELRCRAVQAAEQGLWTGGEVKGIYMCYNCGCGMPDDDMGKGHAGVDLRGTSITNKTFQAAAKGEGMTEEEAKKNTLELLNQVLKK